MSGMTPMTTGVGMTVLTLDQWGGAEKITEI